MVSACRMRCSENPCAWWHIYSERKHYCRVSTRRKRVAAEVVLTARIEALSILNLRHYRKRHRACDCESRSQRVEGSISRRRCQQPLHTCTMADDTRQPPSQGREDLSREALTLNPDAKAFAGSQWSDGKSQTYKPPASANMMEGGTQHTAGGKVPEVTLANAFTTGRPMTEVHKAPCVRDSFMVGLGAGFAAGGGRMIFGSMAFLRFDL